MKKGKLVTGIGVVLLAVSLPLLLLAKGNRQAAFSVRPQEAQATGYKISGPYVYQNLSIFLIHGQDRITGKTILTLQEAMRQKKIIVYETGSVNELAIENVSPNEEVFVQSGDIVKGGQQDRMLGVDLIVPPKSGRIPIAAFCVERGRWSRRGNETASNFSSSTERVATRDLKIAANKERSQTEVWSKVAEAQDKLSQNVGVRVNSAQSESSFQLALENKRVQETADNYTKTLLRIVEGRTDVIGYAFAINGQLNSADVYASNALFKKLWPGLLKASAIEAIAELRQNEKFKPLTANEVSAFLAEAERGASSEREVTRRIHMVTRETKQNILFETRDRSQKEVWVHRSYIKK
jgi:hypothetical protein